ncbi:MAG: nucleoside triphosphate pyrophosphohydrolase, partial [Chryseobacterium sp.]
PDSALERTNLKFISRFQKMENLAAEEGLKLADMTLEEMDVLWEKAKLCNK